MDPGRRGPDCRRIHQSQRGHRLRRPHHGHRRPSCVRGLPTGDLVAFDFSGILVWQKSLGHIESSYGYASSLAVYGGKVIVQLDQGNDPNKSASSLIAYDAATGKVAWTTRRPVGSSWASPIIIHPDTGPLVITCSSPLLMATASTPEPKCGGRK